MALRFVTVGIIKIHLLFYGMRYSLRSNSYNHRNDESFDALQLNKLANFLSLCITVKLIAPSVWMCWLFIQCSKKKKLRQRSEPVRYRLTEHNTKSIIRARF